MVQLTTFLVQAFAWIEKLSGRSYSLFEYVGSTLTAFVRQVLSSDKFRRSEWCCFLNICWVTLGSLLDMLETFSH